MRKFWIMLIITMTIAIIIMENLSHDNLEAVCFAGWLIVIGQTYEDMYIRPRNRRFGDKP